MAATGHRLKILQEAVLPVPLIAANLQVIKSSFTTRSKRKVALHDLVEPENVDQLDWAMQSSRMR